MVTKKQRRKQVSRASAQRRASRQLHREVHRRHFRLLAIVLAAALAVAALAVWIVTHDSGGDTTSAAGGDYDAASVARIQPRTLGYPGE